MVESLGGDRVSAIQLTDIRLIKPCVKRIAFSIVSGLTPNLNAVIILHPHCGRRRLGRLRGDPSDIR